MARILLDPARRPQMSLSRYAGTRTSLPNAVSNPPSLIYPRIYPVTQPFPGSYLLRPLPRRAAQLLLLGLQLLLRLAAVPLLQPGHARLAHLGVAREERLQRVRVDGCLQLDLARAVVVFGL